jgi:hypothetical protein
MVSLRVASCDSVQEGSVAKITGKEGERFSGVAAVFDSEEDMLAALVRAFCLSPNLFLKEDSTIIIAHSVLESSMRLIS